MFSYVWSCFSFDIVLFVFLVADFLWCSCWSSCSGILNTFIVKLPRMAIMLNFLLLKSKHKLRSVIIIYPIACFKWIWLSVNVFLMILAYKIIRLFLRLSELIVKKAYLKSYSSINLIFIFSIYISMLYSNRLIIFLR